MRVAVLVHHYSSIGEQESGVTQESWLVNQPLPSARGRLRRARDLQALPVGSSSNRPHRYDCGRYSDTGGAKSPKHRRKFWFVFGHIFDPDRLVLFLAIEISSFFVG